MQRLKIVVTGDVQGVGYRARCWELASRYGLTGYAKNLPDTSVEVCVEGDEKSVEEFKSHLPNMPGYAEKVDEVESIKVENRLFKSFTIS
jgi:acylphosphatase